MYAYSCSAQGRVIIPEAVATFTTILGSLQEFVIYQLNDMGKECLTFHLLDREEKHLKNKFLYLKATGVMGPHTCKIMYT